MNDQSIIELFNPLYADLVPEEAWGSKRPLLAHYTSIQTLEKILLNNEVWFSNPLFMNDMDEVKFGVIHGVNLVLSNPEILSVCKTDHRKKLFLDSFNHYQNIFANDHVFDTYVFCLSEHDKIKHTDGILSMWRGYGANGNGAAIIFDTAKLNAKAGSPIILSQVKYASREARIEWLKKLITLFANILSSVELSDDKLHLASYALFERIKLMALFSKHDGFKEENEWRIVYLKACDHAKAFISMLDYHYGDRGLEPKFKLKVAPIEGHTDTDLSLEKIIDSIIFGPSVSSPLAKTTVMRMLDKINKSELKNRVSASTIPLRAT